ncbi:MAG: hypothetical protein HY975_00415 [Candidatus Kerfeldbacteria bacterium]|nr:hypothetical protein [Candidatus Kerfeldbacteria bacterium]
MADVQQTPEVTPSNRPVPTDGLSWTPHDSLTTPVVASLSDLDLLRRRIEDILAEGLEKTFRSLPAAEQSRFKTVGEQAAVRLTSEVKHRTPRLERLIMIVQSWLRLIPNLNPYYLEQEAKIKVEKILMMTHPPVT